MSRVWSWFTSRSLVVKIVLLVVSLPLLIFLSPLWLIVSILALGAVLIAFVIRAVQGSPLRATGIAAAALFALLIVSCTSTALVYGGGTAEVAERRPEPNGSNTTAEEDAVEETRYVTVEETVERTVERIVETPPPAPSEREENQRGEDDSSPTSAAAPAPAPAKEKPQSDDGLERVSVQVASVTDGDTVKIAEPVEGLTDVRLIGMDTPETYGGEEPYGPEASAFATEQLSGQTVTLELDEELIDPYDRLLAYVYLPDGTMFNETLVEEGYAQVATFPPNVRYEGDFLAAQSAAQAAGLGIWSLPEDQLCQLADRGNGIGGGCEVAPTPVEQTQAQPAPAVEEASAVEESPGYPSDGWYPGAPDLDCVDFPGGVTVSPGDPFGLDGDGDGIACE